MVRVHPELIERERLPSFSTRGDLWTRRFREINDWERYLTDNGVQLVKLFLNLSREEQRIRFLERIDNPQKNWKFSPDDAREREHWDEYQTAFSDVLSNTSTEWAPWYVIPADHKWFAHIAVGAAVVRTLMQIDPHYPAVHPRDREELRTVRARLEAQAPERQPA